MEYKTLGSLVDRKIGYGIVQPGQNILDGVPVIKVNNLITDFIQRMNWTSQQKKMMKNIPEQDLKAAN